MAKLIDSVTSKKIKDSVYLKADEFEYLKRSRTDNGKFIDSLVSAPEVGVVLANFMSKSEIRTYIKDAILNRYSKDKTIESRPNNLIEVIYNKLGIKTILLEKDSRSGIELYKCEDYSQDVYVVVVDGTYMKWETALKKALMYAPRIKIVQAGLGAKVKIILSVFAQGKSISRTEISYINTALQDYEILLHVYG